MGCIGSKNRRETSNNQANDSQEYSWNTRTHKNMSESTIEKENLATVIRPPGSINGQQIIVQNCEKSTICILDHLDCATIDECKDCTIFMGPTRGSIFVQNCSNCRLMSSSQQFRARDCKNLYLFLHVLTMPTLESCENINIACFTFYYSKLSEQFKSAGLSPFNNSWSQVFDFNAQDGCESWSYLPPEMEAESCFGSLKNLKGFDISFDQNLSVVPKSLGFLPDQDWEIALVIFFPDGNREKRARSFIIEMREKECPLIASKEFVMKVVEAESVFKTDSYNSVVTRGPVIALQHYGLDCIRKSQQSAKTIALETGSTGLVYVSSNRSNSLQQIEMIFNTFDSNQKRIFAKKFEQRGSNASEIFA